MSGPLAPLPASAPPDWAEVRAWVFDLDNTLYPPAAGLLERIVPLMNGFIAEHLRVSAEEADRIRHELWARHGTTLAGLMAEHAVAPGPFLEAVHDITLDGLKPDPALAALIRALPGRRIVHTNAPRSHAERVLDALGLGGLFDAVDALEDRDFIPKPRPEAYRRSLAARALDPARAAMFEDDSRNLLEPARLGMRTVLVADPAAPTRETGAHVHDLADAGLTAFLARLLEGKGDLPIASGPV